MKVIQCRLLCFYIEFVVVFYGDFQYFPIPFSKYQVFPSLQQPDTPAFQKFRKKTLMMT